MPTEFLRGEPFLVSFSARHEATFASPGLNPEEQAIANEEARYGLVEEPDDPPPRKMPPEVTQAIEELPLEDAYMLRRMLDGASQREIAAAVGIRQPSVCHRLGRAMEQIRRSVVGGPPLKRIRARMQLPGVVSVREVRADGPVLRVTAGAPPPTGDTLTLPGVMERQTNEMNGSLMARMNGGQGSGPIVAEVDVLTELRNVTERAEALVLQARIAAESELARLTARCEELREALGLNPKPTVKIVGGGHPPLLLWESLPAIEQAGKDGITFADLLTATGLPEPTLRRELGALRGKGLVTTTGKARSQRYVAA